MIRPRSSVLALLVSCAALGACEEVRPTTARPSPVHQPARRPAPRRSARLSRRGRRRRTGTDAAAAGDRGRASRPRICQSAEIGFLCALPVPY